MVFSMAGYFSIVGTSFVNEIMAALQVCNEKVQLGPGARCLTVWVFRHAEAF